MQTYLDTQRDLPALLEEATRTGEIRIQRADGKTFVLTLEKEKRSPLDVPGVDLGVSTEEILNVIRESRERF
jgi:antitoxin Phd